MNEQALMPLLMFLAGAGFNEVSYAVDKLQKGVQGLTAGNPSAPAGLPQILGMMSGQPSPQAQGGPQDAAQQLGPNPLQALAAIDLKRRMAMMPEQMMGGGGQPPMTAPPSPAIGRFGGQPGAFAAFQQLANAQRMGA